MKKLQLLLSILALPAFTFAQDAYTMKFLPQLQQSQWGAAANETDAKISIGLPVISSTSVNLYNTGFTYHDLFHKVNDSTTAIHPGDFIGKLKSNNFLCFGVSVSLLSFTYAKPDYSIGFSINDRADFQFRYNKNLFNLLWHGNGAFLGQNVDIGNFGVNAMWYREYALHGTRKYKKWTFGASPKLLFGKTNINTQSSSVSLYTDPDFYALTANANINVQTAGIQDSNDSKNGTTPNAHDYIFNTKNKGLAIDLGAKYELNDKITIAGGINDLGYIRWQGQVHNYSSGNTSFTFNGFDAQSYLQGDSNFISSKQFTDSITHIVKFKETSDAYTTALPYELYAMGTYKLNDHHMFGLQINGQHFYKSMIYAATLCYQFQAGKHFTGALTYTAKRGTPFNIGGGIIARFAGMQWYFATDNWWAAVKPLDSKNVNLHMGINIVLGDKIHRNEVTKTNTVVTPAEEERPETESGNAEPAATPATAPADAPTAPEPPATPAPPAK